MRYNNNIRLDLPQRGWRAAGVEAAGNGDAVKSAIS